ncbi:MULTISPECIES: aldehyde dehydrogenase family protein [unclassified Flavobacterium]|uniref:aldehyde dehydrogenase family protein n=1 Tax=unclassified Flavobacterium TaxID=196869 RepID=UPI001F13AC5C|nr:MULTISPECIES: aldehyde dehydrogenase family protein [unclassified Flavobacterium]UMY64566.1 aldehyde dehydrogenase family protein [Flavobacterium sp. HJ-32-4]
MQNGRVTNVQPDGSPQFCAVITVIHKAMRTINKIFVNGQFRTPNGTKELILPNPATGEPLTKVILADASDTTLAIEAANKAFESYSVATLETRRMYLRRIHDVMLTKMDELKSIVAEEYGSPQWFTEFALNDALRSWKMAIDLVTPENTSHQLNNGTTVVMDPVGVAALISPWNLSIWFICVKASTALAAGCSIVMKPSELSPLQNHAMAEIFQQANLPAGLVNVVHGDGETVGNTLTASPGIHKISFTGSTQVGKDIAKKATETMKRVTLELGGKSPSIILDDADLEKAIPFVLQVGLQNSGQSCTAGTRILIPASRKDEIYAALKSGIEELKCGPASSKDSMIGPMVSLKQWERVQYYIQKGIDEGATLLTGGTGRPEGLTAGNFVKPTLFTNVKNRMTIAQEEIFGPVLCVITYDDDEEAIQLANDSNYGLHAYIAGTDTARAVQIARRLQAGRVAINGFVDAPDAPFGGYKQSGMGREFGKYGLGSFQEPKAIFLPDN